jgi:glutathionylspermidine synthase
MAESERAEAAKQKERLTKQTDQSAELEEKLAEATAQAVTLQKEWAVGVEVGRWDGETRASVDYFWLMDSLKPASARASDVGCGRVYTEQGEDGPVRNLG